MFNEKLCTIHQTWRSQFKVSYDPVCIIILNKHIQLHKKQPNQSKARCGIFFFKVSQYRKNAQINFHKQQIDQYVHFRNRHYAFNMRIIYVNRHHNYILHFMLTLNWDSKGCSCLSGLHIVVFCLDWDSNTCPQIWWRHWTPSIPRGVTYTSFPLLASVVWSEM